MKSSYSDPEDHSIRRALRAADRMFARIYHRLDVLSPCQLPLTGPAMLVCNHTSGMDPVFIQSVVRRPIVWMMAKEYYDMPGLNWIYRQVQAIPVARSGRDMTATREALRALQNGRIVGVFPEGKIETDNQLLPFHIGVALMAAKAGVDIFPTYLDGTQRKKRMTEAVGRPQHARIAFGRRLAAPTETDRETLQSTTTAIQQAVQLLKDSADRLR